MLQATAIGVGVPKLCRRPRNASAVTHGFQKLCAELGMKVIRFHDLRHVSASLMLEDGIHPKIVQERLGHSTITTTLDLYAHIAPTMHQQAADRMDALLA
ncbi:MAG: tyrosine-type recombinase/integrase [Candidatus Eremiobacteraeota bacterium]|nr:tyrosine-type recombinase/integrase [Candidatus Eremiobacteraeota bacterium]